MSRVYEIVRVLVLSFVDGFCLVAGILGRGLVVLSSTQSEFSAARGLVFSLLMTAIGTCCFRGMGFVGLINVVWSLVSRADGLR